jgi:hypothetical protein
MRTKLSAEERALREKQSKCFHRLEHLNEPPYRYLCTICRKKLKIASGHYPVKGNE